ncbi:hypothetical protein GCM10022252_28230 [Streptosporangium oxazolinicum]|uniref:Uncharacterized protein n=1 Tax=Streptosporangium oxazolinicum TaxID=909287 RepID=A0ABP8AU95_9ACTN
MIAGFVIIRGGYGGDRRPPEVTPVGGHPVRPAVLSALTPSEAGPHPPHRVAWLMWSTGQGEMEDER